MVKTKSFLFTIHLTAKIERMHTVLFLASFKAIVLFKLLYYNYLFASFILSYIYPFQVGQQYQDFTYIAV